MSPGKLPLLWLAVTAWLAIVSHGRIVHADDAQPAPAMVECTTERSACELAALANCRGPITIDSEQVLSGSAHAEADPLRYRLVYHCGARDPQQLAAHLDWQRRNREQRAQLKLRGPLALLISGSLVPLIAIIPARLAEADRTEQFALRTGFTLLTASLVVPGAVWLGKVVRSRRALDRELRERTWSERVQVGFQADRTRRALSLTLRF